MPVSEADDTDRRFRELIEAEFGVTESGRPIAPTPGDQSKTDAAGDDAHLRPSLAQPRQHNFWFSMDEAIVHADLEPLPADQRWRPAGASLRLSRRGWMAMGLLGLAVVLGALSVSSILPRPWWPAAIVAFGLGLALLLSMVPWRHHDDFDDGARL